MARALAHADNQLTAPVWAGDWANREHVLPGGVKLDPDQFEALDSVVVTTSAQANAAAVSISVTALTGAIPNGTVLKFGAGEFAQLTAAAAAGATSLTVEALEAQIESGDTALYAGTTKKTVLSGTPVGRTFSERANDDPFGPAAASDDEIYLVVWDVEDLEMNNDAELYRHHSVVKENFLPTFGTMGASLLAEIRALYTTTRGAA